MYFTLNIGFFLVNFTSSNLFSVSLISCCFSPKCDVYTVSVHWFHCSVLYNRGCISYVEGFGMWFPACLCKPSFVCVKVFCMTEHKLYGSAFMDTECEVYLIRLSPVCDLQNHQVNNRQSCVIDLIYSICLLSSPNHHYWHFAHYLFLFPVAPWVLAAVE